VRHLVAVSRVSQTKPGADREGARPFCAMTIQCLVLYRVASRYVLPVASEWAPGLCAN